MFSHTHTHSLHIHSSLHIPTLTLRTHLTQAYLKVADTFDPWPPGWPSAQTVGPNPIPRGHAGRVSSQYLRNALMLDFIVDS